MLQSWKSQANALQLEDMMVKSVFRNQLFVCLDFVGMLCKILSFFIV